MVFAEKGDGDSIGVGYVSGRLYDMSHRAIQIKFSTGDRALHLHDVGEGSSAELTFLYRV